MTTPTPPRLTFLGSISVDVGAPVEVGETDDGERIHVSNFGLRSGSPEDIAKLVRREPVPPGRIYLRCHPRMTSTGERWSWLNSRVLVGTGERHPDTVQLNPFVVQ